MRDVGSGQRGRLGLGRLGGAKMWMSHTLGHSEAPEKRSFINTSTRRAIKFYLRCTGALRSNILYDEELGEGKRYMYNVVRVKSGI